MRSLLDDEPNVIMALTETHLNEYFPTQLLEIDGYNVFRRDRVGQDGGGIMLYIPEHFFTEGLEISPDAELSCLSCRSGKKSFLVIVAYRPPSTTAEDTRTLFHHIDNFTLNHNIDDVIVMGDLNIDQNPGSSSPYKLLLQNFAAKH